MLTSYDIAPPFRIKGIYTAFEMSWDSEGDFRGESHDFWELVTVLSGQVEVVEDDRYYVLDGGMMVCHAPGEFHRIRSAGGTSPHFLVLTFEHEGELPKRLTEGIFTLSEEDRESYLSLFLVFRDLYTASVAARRTGAEPPAATEREWGAVFRLESFLLSLSSEHVSEEPRSMSASAQEYRELVRIMSDRVGESLTLSDLASERHISESYVKKLFRTYAGESAMSYYSRLRIREIKLLLDGGESVTAVAEKMNFSSPAYLSTFFKKHTGHTPSEYVGKR